MTDFKDLFSSHASAYAAYRPTYPDELYAFLAGLTSAHDLAWDCATGNGQAAVGLARHYKQVIATDASDQQLAHATQLPNVRYQVTAAEEGPLEPESADLITVAQAAHWFNLEKFFEEVHRVLKPGGVIALWGYKRTRLTESEGIDSIIRHYTNHTLANYWAPEVRLLSSGYQSITFPFRELSPPSMNIQAQWTLDQLLGYLFSWSATQRYIQATGQNPLDKVKTLMEPRWGSSPTRKVSFKLHFRIGRKEE